MLNIHRLILRAAWRASPFALLLSISEGAAAAAENLEPPPLAAQVDVIEQVTLKPLFGERFFCVEHAFGELTYAGDALGTDCVVSGGVEQDMYRIGQWTGFPRLYRTNGSTNADWYGYGMDVMSPTDGAIISVQENSHENTPGTLGNPPAGGVRIRRADGIIVTVGHLNPIVVREGDEVRAGQVLGKVGNNGQQRAPGIHVGAWREGDAVPLQIRWDLRALGLARQAAGVP